MISSEHPSSDSPLCWPEDPIKSLRNIAEERQISMSTKEFAFEMDERDHLKGFRNLFEYPKNKGLPFVDPLQVNEEDECVYLGGNSLGLMPKGVKETLNQFMDQWSSLGVYGHHYGDHPWYICDEELLTSMCRLVGAGTDEVAIMNQLTSCLHFLLLSFYRPEGKRNKILFEDKSFPSDHYAFESQARLHGLDPENVLIAMKPREGEYTLRLEDILMTIMENGEELSLVCFSGVQYYTGQNFNIPEITKYGHEVGAFVGWDLAHSVGNVELELHKWDVDFAVWTTYKYLNAGAGNTGGAFLHSRFCDKSLPYLTGWWGHSIDSRMAMTNKMVPGQGIRRYRMSTPSALHCAALRASLQIFDSVDFRTIRAKSICLTAYFEYLLTDINSKFNKIVVEIITPSGVNDRGAQLSVSFPGVDVDQVHQSLKKKGVVCDQRKPNVIRVAACPLYNSYTDVFRAYQALVDILNEIKP